MEGGDMRDGGRGLLEGWREGTIKIRDREELVWK